MYEAASRSWKTMTMVMRKPIRGLLVEMTVFRSLSICPQKSGPRYMYLCICGKQVDIEGFTHSDPSQAADSPPDYYANRAGYRATSRSDPDSPCPRRLSEWPGRSARWPAAWRPWRAAVRSRSSSASGLDGALRRWRLGWLGGGRGG